MAIRTIRAIRTMNKNWKEKDGTMARVPLFACIYNICFFLEAKIKTFHFSTSNHRSSGSLFYLSGIRSMYPHKSVHSIHQWHHQNTIQNLIIGWALQSHVIEEIHFNFSHHSWHSWHSCDSMPIPCRFAFYVHATQIQPTYK